MYVCPITKRNDNFNIHSFHAGGYKNLKDYKIIMMEIQISQCFSKLVKSSQNVYERPEESIQLTLKHKNVEYAHRTTVFQTLSRIFGCFLGMLLEYE